MHTVTVKAGGTTRLPIEVDEVRPIYYGVECHDSKDLNVSVWFKEKLDDDSPDAKTAERAVVLANRKLDEVIRRTFYPPTIGVLTIEYVLFLPS